MSKAFDKSGYETRNLSGPFKDYWYAGTAEITSYELKQPRYGQVRNGKAVLIFVTEDFLPTEQVKADSQNEKNVPVLKLNSTKDYNTGIYPYSIMSSTFYPMELEGHAIKVVNSVQEWCGQVYSQLNNRGDFQVTSHSYFESEGNKNFTLKQNILEDELWVQLRVDPSSLPTGEHPVIPSLEFAHLKHKELKAYAATLIKTDTTYTIEYPELQRKLVIDFSAEFPYEINGWQETFPSGFGVGAKVMTSTATKIKTLNTPYWKQNAPEFEKLRDTLGL